jgi:hypothetical protein
MSKKINSRAKGQRFERKVAQTLNTKFETDGFMRTPGSGAFATTHKSLPQHLQLQGDLITPQWFAYTIELKSGYDVQDLPRLLSENCELFQWIIQCKHDAKQANRKPLLIVQHDRRQAYCLIDTTPKMDDWLYKSQKTPPAFIAGLELISLELLLQMPNELFIRK